MKRLIYILSVCTVFTQAKAQFTSGVSFPDTTQTIITDSSLLNISYAQSINQEDLEKHLSVLASDEFEGRETGEAGNELAANYISDFFEGLNMSKPKNENSYFQEVAFTFTRWEDVELSVNETKFKHLWDFIAFPTKNDHTDNFSTKEVEFLGYGIDSDKYNDYKGKKVKGKTVMIYSGDPRDKMGNSRITGSSQDSEWTDEKKIMLAKQKGATFVFIIKGDIKKFLEDNRRNLLGGNMQLGDLRNIEQKGANHIFISTTVAKEIMNKEYEKVIKSRDRITAKGKSCKVKMKSEVNLKMVKKQTVLLSKNVMAYLEGSEKPDELVVVSAHYDHIGKKGQDIFNGADDNGTGTCAVLEMTEAFKLAANEGNRQKRSILFLLVTGEEKGLLGSEFYSSNPLYPLDNTIANVNIDMIGRIDDRHDHDNYIYVIGSDRISTDLHDINERLNQDYTQMELDYTYNDENDPNRYYYRSDHYNFAKNGIPSIFFFSGVHEDYHRPGDTVDKINFSKLERTARHIFQLTWELANRDERIKVDNPYK